MLLILVCLKCVVCLPDVVHEHILPAGPLDYQAPVDAIGIYITGHGGESRGTSDTVEPSRSSGPSSAVQSVWRVLYTTHAHISTAVLVCRLLYKNQTLLKHIIGKGASPGNA